MKYFINLLNGLICCFVFANVQSGQSQCVSNCVVQCIGQINVSLDQNCIAEITPAMGGVGVTPACNSYYSIELYDQYGNTMPTDTVDFSHVGEILTYKVIEPECGNACWGDLVVEYKLAPTIDCPSDITIPCAMLEFLCLPPATGGCVDFRVTLQSETSTKLECDPDFTKIIERTYQACDDFGNCSTCTQTISLERLDFSNIKFPEPFTVGNGNAISCCDPTIQYDTNGFPIPFLFDPTTGSGSGVPVLCLPPMPPMGGYAAMGLCIDGMFPITGSGTGSAMIPLVPRDNNGSNLDVCNAIVTYTDVEIFNDGCKRKIARTFEIREWWCNDEMTAGDVQLIEIVDDLAPELTCPSDITVTTGHDCGGSVTLPAADVFDKCSSEITVKVQTPNGIVEGNGATVELSLGNNIVTYIATDGCKNQDNCQFNVTVQDNTGPVAICETRKVVSLSNSTNTIVFAEPFDNGSWDECKLDRFEVRRMDSTCVVSDTLFGEHVSFCCNDVGRADVMVVFRAYDKAGNSNDCMVNVEVQDKSTPSLSCPPDMTIDCRELYDINNLGLTFGFPDVGQNCAGQNLVEIPLPDVDQCGSGTISRKFQILDSQGNAVRTCTQNVTISNDTPFLPIDIIWPLDYEAPDVCTLDNLNPEDLAQPFAYPSFNNVDVCAQLGYDYEDRVFQGNNGLGTCLKIERTWTVINWCGDSDGDGTFDIFINPNPQIIQIINNTSPVILESGPLSFNSINTDCTSGPISVSITATDDCDDLNYSFKIRDVVDNVVVLAGEKNNIEATLQVGQYIIVWKVSDGCGNFDVYEQPVEVLNSKLPSPVCLNGLSASLVLMDLDTNGVFDAEMVELWASDFDGGSSHSCGNPIVLSFSPDTTDKNRIFDCNDIGINQVRVYATDITTGLQDYCSTFIDIQDNNGDNICNPMDGMRVSVAGEIYTEENEFVEDVRVSLVTDALVDTTGNDGDYAFDNMPTGGAYEVIPSKDIDYLNGISTLDIILIQKHILGDEYLDSPYKLIAADVDNSRDISAIDLIELRKLILGITDGFDQNESWRFVDAEMNFLDDKNPWSTDLWETFDIYNLEEDTYIDFIGIKIGDVNGSVIANIDDANIESRSSKKLSFFSDNKVVKAGEQVSIPIYADDYNLISGWQTGMTYDISQVQVLDIIPGTLDISEGKNANISNGQGLISLSYNAEIESESYDVGQVLFEIVVMADIDIHCNDLFKVSSNSTKAEAYDANYSVIGIDWKTNIIEQANIVSATPNPWVDNTTIEFEINHDGDAIWEFYNIDGQLLYHFDASYTEGSHTIIMERSKIDATGIIYVKLITESGISEYKMVVL